MHIIFRLFCLFIFINISLYSSINFNLSNFKVSNTVSNPFVIAVMVEFDEEIPNNPLTSGTGSFLDSLEIEMIWNQSNLDRCDGFILDRPPHDADYFNTQIQALSNYFAKASSGNVDIQGAVILNPDNENGYYALSKEMELYSYGDNDLSVLFKESLEISKNDIEQYLSENPDIDFNEVVFTVFHAGIGQDFSFPTFDPTIYDIKSAYIESGMFVNDLNYPIINGQEIKSGILLPETQNMIFFDSIEDIFYGQDSYCDFQLGMTSTFAFLMGYALGLPPLFDTDSGKPGVGVFALMDYGSNNGRGVIPAFPSPWTRILKYWQQPINMTDSSSVNPLVFDIESDNIYRFDISSNEYFLIENHSNQLDNGQSLSDIINADSLSYWFDSIIAQNENHQIFEFSEDSVIIEVKDYDLGLPGSGLLIWHIDEPEGDITLGINNDRDNRAISIEEADGALDIGFESYALFSNNDPTNGTKWDFWFIDNDAYYYTNDNAKICLNSQNYEVLEQYSSQYQCEQNGGNWVKPTIFDKYSNPNSGLNDGAQSFFSFEFLDSISQDIKRIKVKYESPINYTDYSYLSDFKIIGTSDSNIFFYKDTTINVNELIIEGSGALYSFDFSNQEFNFDSLTNFCSNPILLTDNNNYSSLNCLNGLLNTNFVYFNLNNELIYSEYEPRFGYFNDTELIDHFTINNPTFNIGEIENWTTLENLDIKTYDISIGDIDSDGLDEIVWTSDGKIMAANYNGTMVNSFPIDGNYHGIVLILENEDDEIILVSRNDAHIDILSLNGDMLYSLPSIGNEDILAIGGKLTDGVRFYDFPIGDGSYWLQRYSNHSHYPFSSGEHVAPDYESSTQKIINFYNYPNPIIDRETTFRFKVHDQVNVNINIYNLSGYKVDNLILNNPTVNEYNEIDWNIGSLLPGLYFAEIIADGKKGKIIKVVIGY